MLGTGHFGGAIGRRLAEVGHTVVYGSRTPDSQRIKALVKECGPRTSAAPLKEAVSRGEIVVFALPWDPVKGLLPTLGDLSGKLIIDPMIANPARSDGPISIPLAGADRGANERVARLVSELGLDPAVIGGSSAARYLENLLWMEVAYNIYNKDTRRKCEIYMRRVPA